MTAVQNPDPKLSATLWELRHRITQLTEAYDLLRAGIPAIVPTTYAGRTVYAGHHVPEALAYADRLRAGEETLDGALVELNPIHLWFELTYAQYLTIPRSVLQSMPQGWQARMVACLEELDATIDWRPAEGRYWVELRDAKGRIRSDPLKDYERGRRRVPHRSEVEDSR
jgi:hypothetical protein